MEYEITATKHFIKWQSKLSNRQAAKAITLRLIRASKGNLGDVEPVGHRVSEMRIFIGKGYRIYFTIRANSLLLLLNGGDKSSQRRDIKKAKEILKTLEKNYEH